MYYLTKFCRICVKSDEKLVDLHSADYDLVKFSDKLKLCTNMVISNQDLSTRICMSCVKKLRVSYVFQNMCRKSDQLLQGYLTELIGVADFPKEKFVNSELKIALSPIPKIKLENQLDSEITEPSDYPISTISRSIITHRVKKKRVSKGQRCSLLKKLLSNKNKHETNTQQTSKSKGGLKDLLVFIKDYDFGYKICNPTRDFNDITPLDKLEDFSKTFFYTDFTDYRETILSVINEHQFESSDDDDMFNAFDEEEDKRLWSKETKNFEELIIEPDIKIKTEFTDESDYDYLPTEFVQTCYDEDAVSKQSEFVDFETYLTKSQSVPERQEVVSTINNNRLMGPSSLDLLQQFTSRKGKTISPNSLKCRTRGQPFINPQLMEQFKKRSFKCKMCNRSFKSPGYLHSHCTKMGH